MPLPVALLAAGFAVLLFTSSLPLHELAAAAIVLGTISWERSGQLPLWRPAVTLGDASYSLYLTQLFVLGLTRAIWHATVHGGGEGLGVAGLTVVSTMAIIGGAVACYRWIEAPITAALNRLWVAPARARVQPAAASAATQ
jgi:peptidoglycan/LPS O-acetylase OafA/YrhL